MTTSDLTQHPEVIAILDDLHTHFAHREMRFSDMVDGLGRQYVDLVQEGGGIWGVALLGYTFVLEEMGIRFASMGGTSAGAINTLLLAAANSPGGKRTEKILPYLANKNLFDFVDGNWFSRAVVRGIVRGESRFLLIARGAMTYPRLRRKLGLNPGRNFEEWLAATIGELGVHSLHDLRVKMNDFPEDVRHRDQGQLALEMRKSGVAFIAAEIETGSKVRFPHHARLFYKDHMSLNPARFVRASMSIPLFFEPVVIRKKDLPEVEPGEWGRLLGHHGEPPDRVVLVDGGILSNFPIDVFHQRRKIPVRPTLGVKLMTGSARREKRPSPQPLRLGSFLSDNFSAARHLRDHEFIFSNPDYRHLVAEIDVGDHNWINFSISTAGKLDLFLRGARAARDFLKQFDWEKYREMRAQLIADAILESKMGLEMTFGKPAELLRAALEGRRLKVEVARQNVVLDRIKVVEKSQPRFRILWVDDNWEENAREKQLISKLGPGVSVVEVGSSARAEEILRAEEFELLLSDIRRGDNPKEGIELLNRLVKQGIELPVIFYIENLDPKKGIPAGAFGITNNPSDLLHLVMDVMARQGI